MPAADISSFNTRTDLHSAPIAPAWILEGAPVSRACVVARSTDYSAWTMVWDCTAGMFHWTYKFDETVHILEGAVTITIEGQTRTLQAGDIAFFPAGAVALWHVENYVRKLAFCQKPAPAVFAVPLRLTRRLLKYLGKGVVLVQGSLSEPLPEVETKQAEEMMLSRGR